MSRRDIGLVMAPVWDVGNPQLGLPLLKSYLNSLGHDAFTHDMAIRMYNKSSDIYRNALRGVDDAFLQDPVRVRKMFKDHEDVVAENIEELLDSGAGIFGFSLYYCNYLSAVEIARRIKERDPSRLIVFGGPDCVKFKAAMPAKSTDKAFYDAVDIIIPGEGETALARLLERFKSGGLRPFPGALVKMDGDFVADGEAVPVDSLDSLPFADFTDYNLGDYALPNQLVTYMTRGCIRNCTFCDVRYYWGDYRTRTGRRVFEDICHQVKRHPGVSSFWFCDSIINANLKELESFCDLMIAARSNGMPPISWHAYAVVRGDMSLELMRKLARSGCVQLQIGIESGSQKVLRDMRKGYLTSMADGFLRLAHEAGIHTHVLLMVGYPTETERDFQETLGFLERNAPFISTVAPSEGFVYITAGTPFFKTAVSEYGVDPATLPGNFWSTLDGSNAYPERMRRFYALCEATVKLGLDVRERLERVNAKKEHKLAEYARHIEKASGTATLLKK